MDEQNRNAGYGAGLDRNTAERATGPATGGTVDSPTNPGFATAGPANTPPFGTQSPASRTAADHQIPADTGATMPPLGGSTTQRDVSQAAGALKDSAERAAGNLQDKVQGRVNQGMDRAASGLETAARKLDDAADQQGFGATGTKAKAVNLAHGAADGMESVSRYLRSNDAADLQQDMERQVRENPLQTLLVGVAAGWLIGKILR